jgi:hypothetical protein
MGQEVCVVDLRDGGEKGSLNPLGLAVRCGTDAGAVARSSAAEIIERAPDVAVLHEHRLRGLRSPRLAAIEADNSAGRARSASAGDIRVGARASKLPLRAGQRFELSVKPSFQAELFVQVLKPSWRSDRSCGELFVLSRNSGRAAPLQRSAIPPALIERPIAMSCPLEGHRRGI